MRGTPQVGFSRDILLINTRISWSIIGASDATRSGLPAPIALEALPVPLNYRLWLKYDKDGAPVRPQL